MCHVVRLGIDHGLYFEKVFKFVEILNLIEPKFSEK